MRYRNYHPIVVAMILSYSTLSLSQVDSLVDKVAGKQEHEFQQSVEDQAHGDVTTLRQFIIDSLQLVHEEILQSKTDSLTTHFRNRIAVLEHEKQQIKIAADSSIQVFLDSLENLSRQTKETPREIEYDPQHEAKYFAYQTFLKQQKSKKSDGFFFLKTEIENIYPFQAKEAEAYINAYFPKANCDSVQDFLTQLHIRAGDWPQAALSIIKFLYLYPESPLYNDVKTIRTGIFQTEKAYKEYADYLTTLIGTIPSYPKKDVGYFKFVETLKDFPNSEIRNHFIKEANRFINLYPQSDQAPIVTLWIGDALLKRERPQSAFLVFKRLMTVYPSSDEMVLAQFKQGKIQEKHFQEYQNAIDNYYRVIENFPDDTLAPQSHYRIAKIADENLQNWEKAVSEYQIFADQCQDSARGISALKRRGAILSDEMNLIEDAVATFLLIDERYPNTPDAEQAIMRAGDLYARHKLYDSSVQQYESLFGKYPESQLALSALEKAAELYEKRLNNTDKQIESLNLIIENFPDSKSAAKAQKTLSKM